MLKERQTDPPYGSSFRIFRQTWLLCRKSQRFRQVSGTSTKPSCTVRHGVHLEGPSGLVPPFLSGVRLGRRFGWHRLGSGSTANCSTSRATCSHTTSRFEIAPSVSCLF